MASFIQRDTIKRASRSRALIFKTCPFAIIFKAKRELWRVQRLHDVEKYLGFELRVELKLLLGFVRLSAAKAWVLWASSGASEELTARSAALMWYAHIERQALMLFDEAEAYPRALKLYALGVSGDKLNVTHHIKRLALPRAQANAHLRAVLRYKHPAERRFKARSVDYVCL